MTLVWQIWQIEEIHQTLIRQLVTFILFTIRYTVKSPNFLLPTFQYKPLQTFVLYGK